MTVTSSFARRFRLLALLRGSLVAGAVYDLGFAALMVAAPRMPARIFDLPLPPLPRGAFYLWILATLLADARRSSTSPRPTTRAATARSSRWRSAAGLVGALAFPTAALPAPDCAASFPWRRPISPSARCTPPPGCPIRS